LKGIHRRNLIAALYVLKLSPDFHDQMSINMILKGYHFYHHKSCKNTSLIEDIILCTII
jgi:hypothetical protein